jgi:hypothetical protein
MLFRNTRMQVEGEGTSPGPGWPLLRVWGKNLEP